MSENYHPSAAKDFILRKLRESKFIDESTERSVGDTTTFLRKGDQKPHKRTVRVYSPSDEVNFIQATGLAISYGFIGELMEWYWENKKWKEGEYVARLD